MILVTPIYQLKNAVAFTDTEMTIKNTTTELQLGWAYPDQRKGISIFAFRFLLTVEVISIDLFSVAFLHY